ncbi:hypothetical protein TSAR_007226 [Trichomalopsis sarcophagae]|uniref:Uncharacterized protein n=1 Tax=Trichomalopsis sarcophagae TaxID=543379 RepID=A0A232ETM2_9HYME|nr:hypothetical protein TSAR_007226 [Trichomalopsis sarcophagae]
MVVDDPQNNCKPAFVTPDESVDQSALVTIVDRIKKVIVHGWRKPIVLSDSRRPLVICQGIAIAEPTEPSLSLEHLLELHPKSRRFIVADPGAGSYQFGSSRSGHATAYLKELSCPELFK